MRTEKNRDGYGKKKKNPQAVRNQRVLICTFVIILALMFQSNRWELEKERLMEMVGGMTALDGKSQEADDGEVMAVTDMKTEAGAEAGNEAVTETEAETETEAGAETETETGAGQGDVAGDNLILREEDMWCLILTNAMYPVPDDYEVELAKVPGSGQSVDTRIYEPLMSMFEAMKAEGLSPLLCSGYRTLDKQEKLFNRKVQTYVKQGYSMEEANAKARQVLSIPGSGEHCLGLAVDIYASSYKKLETGFENRPEGKWLREHAQDYGFTLRYDKGKEEVTGIQYEPWHFRYVGVEVARYLKEHQLSLEEFYIEQSLYG